MSREDDGNLRVNILDPMENPGSAQPREEPGPDAQQGRIRQRHDLVAALHGEEQPPERTKGKRDEVHHLARDPAPPGALHSPDDDPPANFKPRDLRSPGMTRDDRNVVTVGGQRLGQVGEQLRRGGFLGPVKTIEKDDSPHRW